jgi:2-oxo-3-hexenedioate decarboxylase
MQTEAIAGELLAALDGNRPLDAITSRVPGFDGDAAYLVSAEILRRRRARGEAPVGRKIGFTNRTIWPEYGVSAPMWAHVYDTTVTYLDEPSGQKSAAASGKKSAAASGRLAIGHLAQPRLEPEIVLHFAQAPRATDDEIELLSNVDWIAHGYEIVQCHFPNWRFKLPDTIADFGLHGALVVGPKRQLHDPGDVARQLRTFTITLANEGKHDGEVAAKGAGANVLGSPLAAAMHLLRVLEHQPQFEPIRAGEVVTTGTLLSPPDIVSGEAWVTELAGIDLPGLRLRLE